MMAGIIIYVISDLSPRIGIALRIKVAHVGSGRNLTGDARKNLKLLLAANKRLNTAYVLKESFAQLWDYSREPWARKRYGRDQESLSCAAATIENGLCCPV
jgi:hypothetical protein